MEVQENDSLGLRLLKKGQKGIVHAIFSRFGVLLLLLMLQFFILFGMFFRFNDYYPQYAGITTVLSVIAFLPR